MLVDLATLRRVKEQKYMGRDSVTEIKPLDLSLFTFREYWKRWSEDEDRVWFTAHHHPDIKLGHLYLIRINRGFIVGSFSMHTNASDHDHQIQYLAFTAANHVFAKHYGAVYEIQSNGVTEFTLCSSGMDPQCIDGIWELNVFDPEPAKDTERNISLNL